MKNHSRYFVFSRINPRPSDIILLSRAFQRISVDHYGYQFDRSDRGPIKKRRIILKGFFVLSKQVTLARNIEGIFPNFLIVPMPSSIDLDFDRPMQSMTIVGKHPYSALKKIL